MIYLYSGTPGSGKSLHAAAVIRRHLKFFCPVIGTFHINKDRLFKKSKYEFTYVAINELTPEFLVKYARKNLPKGRNPEGSFLLVIDEAQIIFNPREWGRKDRTDWIKFFSQHRKFGYDIILISQNDRMLDRQIRSLLEYQIMHRKVSQFGIAGKILALFVGQFVAVKMWYPLKEKIDAEFFRGDRKLYDFYNSYEDFGISTEGGGQGDPTEGDLPNTIENEKSQEFSFSSDGEAPTRL